MPQGICLDPLESRRLMAVSIGTNLLVNGDAEASAGVTNATAILPPAGWTVGSQTNLKPGFTALEYGVPTFPPLNSPGPANRGKNLFVGGPFDSDSVAIQTIDVSSIATDIASQRLSAELSGFLGGFAAEGDRMTLNMYFLDKNQQQLSSGGKVSAGTVTAADRGNVTGLLFKTTSKVLIPTGTRFIQVEMQSARAVGAGTYNDSYADNISLKLFSDLGNVGQFTGRVRNDLDGDGFKDTNDVGLARQKVFIDANNNGKLDTGETSVAVNSGGAFTFTNLKPAKYTFRSTVPAGFRASSANPLSITINKGLTSTSDFMMTQTALVAGIVYEDVNRNDRKDSGELGVVNTTVYLDLNRNGELDDFDRTLVTDSKGVYRISVPFGKYIVRMVAPKGFKQTSPLEWELDLDKAEVSGANHFAVVTT